jgi:ATP-dependent Clp protease adaptor protein ClpS
MQAMIISKELSFFYHLVFKSNLFKLELSSVRDSLENDIKEGEIKEADHKTSRVKPELKEPSMYKVLLVNDDYTHMDFVVEVLCSLFYMTQEKAQHVMMSIHKNGSAVCGVFTKDVAETKVMQVNELSKKNQFPLLCKIEKID